MRNPLDFALGSLGVQDDYTVRTLILRDNTQNSTMKFDARAHEGALPCHSQVHNEQCMCDTLRP